MQDEESTDLTSKPWASWPTIFNWLAYATASSVQSVATTYCTLVNMTTYEYVHTCMKTACKSMAQFGTMGLVN